jgi:hypothetical protein
VPPPPSSQNQTDASHSEARRSGLLRRHAPRNDKHLECHGERNEAIPVTGEPVVDLAYIGQALQRLIGEARQLA